jgi:hypothetical protein
MDGHSQRGGRNVGPKNSQTGTKTKGWSAPRSGRFNPWERLNTHFTEGWVGLGAWLDGQENLAPKMFSNTDMT